MRRSGPDIEIGRLRLHLPAGHGERGSAVARLVGERLAAMLPPGLGSRERLELRGLVVPAGASDHELAAAISAAIVDELAGPGRGGPRG